MTIDEFARAVGCPFRVAAVWLDPMQAAMDRFEINTPKRIAAFLAQVGHESAGLTALKEQLNYRSDALMRTWPARFPRDVAERVGRTAAHPANIREIAEIAYGGRMGNGPTGSGDAYRCIGRGPIQITGTDNYIRCGHMLGVDLLGDPTLLEGPKYGALSAGWFWAAGNRTGRSLNALADAGNVRDISDIVNGTTGGRANGIVDRLARNDAALQIFA